MATEGVPDAKGLVMDEHLAKAEQLVAKVEELVVEAGGLVCSMRGKSP